jgi:competence protein ComEA
MKNPFYNWLTDDEQKIILFLIVFGLIGLFAQFTGLAANENPELADSLKAAVEKDFEITYDLRTISKKELITIPGIGEKRAEDILLYREENGFHVLHDLMKVRGIGEATFARLEPFFIPFGILENAASDSKVNDDKLTIRSKSKSQNTSLTSGKININTANSQELQKIKGVGPATAEKILILRKELGSFSSVEQLLKVQGIGPKTLEKMLPYIEL